MGDQLLTLADVAHHLQVSEKTVTRLLVEDPEFPRPVVVRHHARWLPDQVRDWERLQQIKAQAAPRTGTTLDNTGQHGTNGPPAGLPPSRRRKSK
jgi:predicted DNA-binding transcriptional regulator AlpA